MQNKDLNILSDEDIVKMAQEGSGTACEFLIDKYRDMVKTRSRTYYINGADNEDVIQEGMIGLFKAVQAYDPKAGTRFSTFAELCVSRQIQTAITGANRQKNRILNESISLSQQLAGGGDESEDGQGEISDTIPADAEGPEELALINETVSALVEASDKLLSPFERKVWHGMLRGRDYREIAAVLGRSEKSVDNAMQRVKKKIRFRLFE